MLRLKRSPIRFHQHEEPRAMQPATLSRIFVGPFGLHALGFVMLGLFALFLWAFNFTTFF
jgi:hypothetical protein